MFEGFKSVLLGGMKVPPEPEAPFGDPGSIRVFRAGRNFYRLKLLGWGASQVGAMIGLGFWIVALFGAQNQMHKAVGNWAELVWVLKGLSVLAFLAQLPVTYAMVRLDYEMRWYVVTDRSLRIRTGIWNVQEMTMSFANVQHVALSQGPLQRLLGLADVQVRSAGGGGGQQGQHGTSDHSMHQGHFHGVENAEQVRDLILERLRRFREAGLGDPEDQNINDEEDGSNPSESEIKNAVLHLREELGRFGKAAPES